MLKLNKLSKAIMLGAALSTSGCASMFSGTKQTVSIRSDIKDTKLYVNDGYVGKDSGITTFKKSKDYFITAKKEGCKSTTMKAEKSFDPVTLLGILIDYGLITILLIDGAATGAWQEFDQENYVIDPECEAEV